MNSDFVSAPPPPPAGVQSFVDSKRKHRSSNETVLEDQDEINYDGKPRRVLIPLDSPVWYRSTVPRFLLGHVGGDVLSDAHLAVAQARKESATCATITKITICMFTAFFPILCMDECLQKSMFINNLQRRLSVVNKEHYSGSPVLSASAAGVVFNLDVLAEPVVVHTHEPLGHEPLERLMVYNEAFEFHMSEGSMPQMAVAENPVQMPQSPLPKLLPQPNRDATTSDPNKKYIYPITAENMGEVPIYDNNYVVPRTSSFRPGGSSSRSNSFSSRSSISTLDCVPPPRLASPLRRCDDDRSTPLSCSSTAAAKPPQQPTQRLESKALPLPIKETTNESKTAPPQNIPDVKTTLPTKSMVAAVTTVHQPTPTARSV